MITLYFRIISDYFLEFSPDFPGQLHVFGHHGVLVSM